MADSAGPMPPKSEKPIVSSPGDVADAAFEARYQAALSRVPFRAPIYLPTDRVPLEQRAIGMERVADIHNGALTTSYRDQIRALRRRHAGTRRAFIIGNGPSLNQTDLSQLAGEVTFCVNGFFLKMPELDWTPTYYVVEDHLVAEDRAAAINALTGPTKLFPAYLAYCLDPGPDTIFFNHRARKSFPEAFDFSTDAAEITYTGCTVTYTCMQLAHYMGFEEIYLIGVDATYDIPKDVVVGGDGGSTAVLDMASEDPNHFHPDYFGKGMRWHDPQVDKMIEAYGEARKVSDALGRPIYNATVGGALEVFERRAFGHVFPAAVGPARMAEISGEEMPDARRAALNAAKADAETAAGDRYPRVLLLDAVPPGEMTATGELKSTLFAPWPEDKLLQITVDRHRLTAIGGGLLPGASRTSGFSEEVRGDIAREFRPDLVLFRPIPDRDLFNDVAFGLVEGLDVPRALWIMDDWPAHLEQADPAQWAALGPCFLALVEAAALRIAISPAMAEAFEARYGQPFLSISNAVDPAQWPARPISAKGAPVRIRYGGGLSSKMTLQSLLDLAEAVEGLGGAHDVVLEINTRDHWARKYGDRFSGFTRTTLTTDAMSPSAYRAWLQAADMTAIVYNFDAESVDYVRYSMANKTVECLASGAPPLVYGPSAIHTVDWLEGEGLGLRVAGEGAGAIRETLTAALADREQVLRAGERARAHVFTHRALDAEQERFRGALVGAARERSADPAKEAPLALSPTVASLNAEYRGSVLAEIERAEAEDRRRRLAAAPGSRMGRMQWFYTGWRGLLALAGMVAPLGAACLYGLMGGPAWGLGLVLGGAMTVSLAIMFFFIAYLFSLIEDYSPAGRPRG